MDQVDEKIDLNTKNLQLIENDVNYTIHHPRQLKNINSDLEKEIIHHKFKLEDDELENYWKSCCLILDKRFCQFFSQMGVMLLIIIFCIVQLTRLDDCNNQRAYVGLLTFIVGILMPQPKIN